MISYRSGGRYDRVPNSVVHKLLTSIMIGLWPEWEPKHRVICRMMAHVGGSGPEHEVRTERKLFVMTKPL